jgi:signal peptidase I
VGTLLVVGSVITQSGGWMLFGGIGTAVLGATIWTLSGVEWRQALEWGKSGAIALGIALCIRWAFAEPYRIPSQSMYPALYGDERLGQGDRVFVNKWIYGVRVPFMNKRLWRGVEPARWDIVVFKTVEENAQHDTLVKRIVGLPGERIEIRDGKVHVNGKALTLPPGMPADTQYTSPATPWSDMRYGILPDDAYSVVPPDHYLLLGDNSPNSRDGRVFGWVPNEHLVGRVASVWWPPRHWRDFTGFSDTLWWRAGVLLLGIYTVLRLWVGRSWVLYRADGRGREHVLISFLHLGLRLPLSAWRLWRWAAPRRGDIVLYHMHSERHHDGILVAGRVVALPGEQVRLADGVPLVNEAPVPGMPEQRFRDDLPGAVLGGKNAAVPDAHLFVLAEGPDGDDTLDSRVLGFVPVAHVAGKAVAVWWPLSRIRRMR